MIKPPKNPLDTTLKSCLVILELFAMFIGLFLTYYSFRFSFYTPMDGSSPYLIKDSLAKNLVFLIIAICFTFLLEYVLKRYPGKQDLLSYLFLAICCVLFFVAGCIWTTRLPYYPTGDQINTTAAAQYALEGNFTMFQKGGYIGIYSQQKGLVFFYEILFSLFGSFCYHVIEKFHVISGVLVMIFGFLFLKDFSSRCIYRFIYCTCVLFCAPYMILMPYAYGDIPSICFCVILFWAIQRYSKALQNRYILIAAAAAIFALFNRQNTWIVLIAVGIGFCLLALEKHSIRPVIAGCSILVASALSIALLNLSYELRSGYENTGGTPASLYFAMGMQEGPTGYGTYNRFNQGTYENVNFDKVAAAELGWLEVENRLAFFKEYPEHASYFFTTKIQQQWIEPLFETLLSTASFPSDSTLPEWIQEIYYGQRHDTLFRFTNYYQNIVYAALLAYIISLFRKQNSSMTYVPLIAIVGGFLFSIIWEAQCRYVLPYYIFTLVYMPIGLCNICDAIAVLFRKPAVTESEDNALASEQDKDSAA